MTVLTTLRGTVIEPEPPPPTPIKKGRKEVIVIVQKAPTGARTLAWWQRWLEQNWT